MQGRVLLSPVPPQRLLWAFACEWEPSTWWPPGGKRKSTLERGMFLLWQIQKKKKKSNRGMMSTAQGTGCKVLFRPTRRSYGGSWQGMFWTTCVNQVPGPVTRAEVGGAGQWSSGDVITSLTASPALLDHLPLVSLHDNSCLTQFSLICHRLDMSLKFLGFSLFPRAIVFWWGGGA